MAMTRDEIGAELANINARLSAGVVRVQGSDRSVQYDLAEARRRRDELRTELLGLDAPVRVRQVRVSSTRGY